jgi:amino acid adenylation domain-containing protein
MNSNRVPASSSQRMLWLFEHAGPDKPAYNLPRALLIKGKLDIQALHDSFQTLVRRHDALRLGFVEHDGQILQQLDENATIDLPVQDLTHLPRDERVNEALRLVAAEGRVAFDLARAPLLRIMLLRIDDDAHVLSLVVHHIVADGWSLSIFFDEIAEIYRSRVINQVPDLRQLRLRSADYARWQQDHLTEAALEKDLAYWQATLHESPVLLEIPTDHVRPANLSHAGSCYSFRIEPAVASRLEAACRRARGTLYMGLLAVFHILLARFTGSRDILVGTPVSGRNDENLHNLIGCFVNTVVMRINLEGDPGFAEMLSRVREVVLGALSHQEVTLEQLIRHLRPERHRSHAPIFQVMLVLQNMPKQFPRIPGLDVEELAFDRGMAKFDLTLEVVEQDDGLNCEFEYRTDLFEPATIARMAGHFLKLLASALDTLDVPVSRLPIMNNQERARLLVEWNQTSADYPRDARIDEAFAAVARRNPGAVALSQAGKVVTYAELDHRSNQIARALIGRNIPAETPVGVYMPRSVDAYAAILGILKAGYPYMPLDVSQPMARLRRLIVDCGCGQILTRRDLAQALPKGTEAILLDTDSAIWTGSNVAPPLPRPGSNVAYILYTSGSTGDPKGVVGTHRACINRFEWMYRAWPFQPGEVCCQKTALGFVDSIWETFGPLLAGVPVEIASEDDVLDPDRLLALLAKTGATRLVLVPTLLGVLLDHAPDLAARLPRLRHWTTSGEYLPADLAARFKQAFPDAVLLNLYGSSEVAADATWHEVREISDNKPVPIGRPISNTRVYILDSHLQPVPIGVKGQIYIGGDCVAIGYWGSPALTAERFIPDPFRSGVGRLFASGDLGRFLADGSIEYLGRRDHQVKIRGYRIEPSEVEFQLAAHPHVRQAAVIATPGALGDARKLVAYVVGRAHRAPPADELRAYLRTRLPQYMVPAEFVEMDDLPLLPSGKVDLRALPPPRDNAKASPRAARPRTPTQAQLAEVWCELLEVSEVRVTDDFFNIGGDSLLAMQLLARIRQQFEVDIPVRSLFDTPTIEHLAQEIEIAKATGATPRRVSIQPQPTQKPNLDLLAAELGKLSPEQIELLLRRIRDV